ncbi:glyoxalase [Cryobacterium sp. MLB-32]|uniref:VOC family protein n=1 Tax=Cryobacterium sp. MLB-32 TaxID=1529318 RepID=UPI0004E792C5|nr:VOC family protein [Cryobacterium sp. MLB-32]KFF57998.1 glyoxalase [Cryobacterium sp. MLB-32]
MLRGFATVSYFAADLEAARKWYSELLGIDAYFQMPGYVEFRVGDYQNELGIIDATYAPPAPDGPAGEIIQWHVDDLPGSFKKLLSMGATEYQPPTDRSEGFVTASVVDPFGNILGIMCNPHYLEVLKKVSGK